MSLTMNSFVEYVFLSMSGNLAPNLLPISFSSLFPERLSFESSSSFIGKVHLVKARMSAAQREPENVIYNIIGKCIRVAVVIYVV